MKPPVEDMFLGERRMKLVRLSVYAANVGGMKMCIENCHDLNDPEGPRATDKRCCSLCNANYLTPKAQARVVEELGIRPSKEHGYWGEKGCSLPRSHRPNLCIGFYCRPGEAQMRREKPAVMTALARAQRELSEARRHRHAESPDGSYWRT